MLVITDTGEKLGLLTKAKALQEAESRGMDLVLVSPDSNPPVAKMMDYSRFRFEQQKKAKEMKKKQKVVKRFNYLQLLKNMTSKLRLKKQEQY